MDNLLIQVIGSNKAKVESLINNILYKLGFKETKLKIIKKEDGITTFLTRPQKFYLLENCVLVSGIEEGNINLDEFRYLSKDYDCIIMMNFEFEEKYEDIIFKNGQEIRCKLPDDQFVFETNINKN